MPCTSNPTTNVYDSITQQIIQAIETGTGDYQMPWHRSGMPLERPTNIASGNAYRGINTVALWAASFNRGYNEGIWGTYRQWQELGAQVRKGEKSSHIVFYKPLDKDEQPEKNEAPLRFIVSPSRVFNVAQVDGYEPSDQQPTENLVEPVEATEAFVANTGAIIRQEGQRAFYSLGQDAITMPDQHRFLHTENRTATENWYAVLLHELTHWTGCEKRLDRTFGKRKGDEAYAMEELVAELGAAFLCGDLGLSSEPREDHACYIESWLRILKADSKAIFAAASQASKAAEYLASLQPQEAA